MAIRLDAVALDLTGLFSRRDCAGSATAAGPVMMTETAAGKGENAEQEEGEEGDIFSSHLLFSFIFLMESGVRLAE